MQAVIVGGAALSLLGLTERQTRDVDVLLPDLSAGIVFAGEAITMSTLGRDDLLKTKLFALCDRGTDLQDCLALAPTEDELSGAESWIVHQDTNPMWPEHVRGTLDDLRRRLGHGVS